MIARWLLLWPVELPDSAAGKEVDVGVGSITLGPDRAEGDPDPEAVLDESVADVVAVTWLIRSVVVKSPGMRLETR